MGPILCLFVCTGTNLCKNRLHVTKIGGLQLPIQDIVKRFTKRQNFGLVQIESICRRKIKSGY